MGRWQFQTQLPGLPALGQRLPTAGPGPAARISVGGWPGQRLLVRPGGPLSACRRRRLPRPPLRRPRPRSTARSPAFLRSYQLDGGYTPGPLLALLALLGVAGSVLALIRPVVGARGPARPGWPACCSPRPPPCVLLAPDVYEFSWRYELPAVITLAARRACSGDRAAGLRRRRAERPSPGEAGRLRADRSGSSRPPRRDLGGRPRPCAGRGDALTRQDRSVRRSREPRERAGPAAQRRAAVSDPLGGRQRRARARSIQILFRTS